MSIDVACCWGTRKNHQRNATNHKERFVWFCINFTCFVIATGGFFLVVVAIVVDVVAVVFVVVGVVVDVVGRYLF